MGGVSGLSLECVLYVLVDLFWFVEQVVYILCGSVVFIVDNSIVIVQLNLFHPFFSIPVV